MSLSAASRKRLDRTTIYVVSVAAHVLFFVVLGLGAPQVQKALVHDEAPPVEVFIIPPQPREAPRRRTTAPSPLPSPVRPRQVVTRPLPIPVAPLPMAPVPAPPPPAPPAPAPATGGGSGGAADQWAVQPGGDLRDALRRSPVGCANPTAVGLNRREREACAEKLGAGAADAPYIPPAIGKAKRDRFDASAASKARDRRWREGPVPPGIDPAASPGQITGLDK